MHYWVDHWKYVCNEEEIMRINKPIKDNQRVKEVVLYILNKLGSPQNETVLHNILYFIDFDYYEKYEEQLMGLTYIKKSRNKT